MLAVKVPLSALDDETVVGRRPTWTSGTHQRSRHPEKGGVTLMSQAQNTYGLMTRTNFSGFLRSRRYEFS
jgi:hypothetical protein